MKFEHIEVFNFEGSFRGMRNPKASWNLSDSIFNNFESISKLIKIWDETSEDKKGKIKLLENEEIEDWLYRNGSCLRQGTKLKNFSYLGPRDLKLAQTLILAGSEHRKFMRQIFVCMDITAPIFWWKEADTYKVGTVANSTSTMHKLVDTPITLDCFEIDDFDKSIFANSEEIDYLIQFLEGLRQKYLATKDKRYWKELIRWLPESWLQTRTITMTYENLYNMCGQRKNHKLNEWSGIDNPYLDNFISMARTLPYAQELIFVNELIDK